MILQEVRALMRKLSKKQEEYIAALIRCNFDLIQAYKIVHGGENLSSTKINARATKAFLWAVGDLLKERWGVLDTD